MEMPNDVSTQEQNHNLNHDINSPDFYAKNQESPAGGATGQPKKGKIILMGVLGFLIAASLIGVFVYVISQRRSTKLLSPFSELKDSVVQENIVVNPMTGVEYKESEAQSWAEYRPLGFMVNNYLDARPQSGLVDADIVYEIVAEGGITRFLAFYLSNVPEKVGPIRSAREYYLVIIKELGDAMLMHHGYSPQALEAIETWPVRSLQRGGADSDVYCPGCTWRDTTRNVAVEHTLYANAVNLRKRGDELGWEGVGEFRVWRFKEDSPISAAGVGEASDGEASSEENGGPVLVGQDPLIEIDFWYEGDYSGIFKYNPDTNAYLRFTGYDTEGNPIPHKDAETEVQVEVKNLIIQFVTESPITGDDKNRLEYQLVGSGEGKVFMDGAVEDVTWTKEDRDGRTLFYDLDGNEVEFNRGKFWIAIVPDRNVEQVTY